MKIFAKPLRLYFALFLLTSVYLASGTSVFADTIISLQPDGSVDMTNPNVQTGTSSILSAENFSYNASSSVYLQFKYKLDSSTPVNAAISLSMANTQCAGGFVHSQMVAQGLTADGVYRTYNVSLPMTYSGGPCAVLAAGNYTGIVALAFNNFIGGGVTAYVAGSSLVPYHVLSTDIYLGDADNSTHIISLDPADGFVATSTGSTTDVVWNYVYNINEEDIGTAFSVLVTLHNIDQNVLLSTIFSEDDIIVYDFVATTSGIGGGSGFFTLKNGNYRIKAELSKTLFGLRIPFQTPYDTRSNQFIVGSSTFIGRLSQNSYSSLNGLYANASSTASYSYNLNTCNPFTGSPSTLFLNTAFDVGTCAGVLFIPDQGLLNDSLDSLKENVLNRFPLGYVTDFVSIVATTSTSSLTVIDAYTPSVLPGGGSHIRLDLAGVFDTMLYATTSKYANVSASSTRTFYEITSDYWKIIVYVTAFLYILGRIVGTQSVPQGFGKHGALSDTNSGDDSYALKEKLYKMSLRKK